MRGHARVDSILSLLVKRKLTPTNKNVTVNPIRGDQEFMKEIQPHLNDDLWPIYLEQADRELRPVDPPTDGSEEAPGGPPTPK